MSGSVVKRRTVSPTDGPQSNAGTMAGSDGGGLLGYLANNFPDLYAKLARMPREPSRGEDFKSTKFARRYGNDSAKAGRYKSSKRRPLS